MEKLYTTNGSLMNKCLRLMTRWPHGWLRPRHTVLLILLVAVTAFRTIPRLGYAYTLYIYPHIARPLSVSSGLLTFAIGDLFIATSILWVVLYPIYAIVCKKRKKSATILRVAEYLLWVYVWFYAAWGINYSQPDIFRRIGMKHADVSDARFRKFAYSYADSLNSAYAECMNKTPLMLTHPADRSSEIAIYRYKLRTMRQIICGYNTMHGMGVHRPFVREAYPKTMVFSRLASAAGVTGSMEPFFSEFTINADVQPHEYPATCAHEFAHFLGIANEGEANFYAYAVCTSSADAAMRFGGYYSILFHMLANVHAILGEKEYTTYLRHIRPEIVALARHDRQYWLSRHSSIIDATQNFLYNLYLRGNNVEGGMRSYSGVVAIIMAWEAHR